MAQAKLLLVVNSQHLGLARSSANLKYKTLSIHFPDELSRLILKLIYTPFVAMNKETWYLIRGRLLLTRVFTEPSASSHVAKRAARIT